MTSVIAVVKEFGKQVDDFLLGMLGLGVSDEFLEIVRHQVVAGGKRLRPALTILACEAVGGESKSAIPAAAAIELVHNYTLIFDDVIDRSDLRRGSPTVRAKYGDVMAILAGMHYREAIFEATRRSHKSRRIENVLSVALRRIIEGERLDVLFEQAGRRSKYVREMAYKVVKEEDYLTMIGAKTATLFEAACKVGSIVGNGTPEEVGALSGFGWNCGMAFQMIDDVLDISGKEEDFGKDVGKDIREHKLGNIVVLYSLQELSEIHRDELLRILRSWRLSDREVDEALEIVLSTKATKRAQEASRGFVDRARSDLKVLPESEAKRLLMNVADFVVKRSS